LNEYSSIKYIHGHECMVPLVDGRELIYITSEQITLPLHGIAERILSNGTTPDKFVDLGSIEEFIKQLSAVSAIKRLNHIGFCYTVDDQNQERQNLVEQTCGTKWNLYEMQSTDAALWLFLGDTTYWQDPMIEFLPVRQTSEDWIAQHLPHIHIDLDTTLDAPSIEQLANQCLGDKRSAVPMVVIDGIIYQMRIRLGSVHGVKIMLDLSTRARDTRSARTTYLQKLD
jgi:hypothetical protein